MLYVIWAMLFYNLFMTELYIYLIVFCIIRGKSHTRNVTQYTNKSIVFLLDLIHKNPIVFIEGLTGTIFFLIVTQIYLIYQDC